MGGYAMRSLISFLDDNSKDLERWPKRDGDTESCPHSWRRKSKDLGVAHHVVRHISSVRFGNLEEQLSRELTMTPVTFKGIATWSGASFHIGEV